jgi:hypothetical protein
MVLGDYEYTSDPIRETSMIGSQVSLRYDCLVSMIPMREADWRTREDSFLTNVRREGVTVA